MKKIFALLVLVISASSIFSQSSLSFCVNVEKDGMCDFSNTKFISAQDSSLNKVYMRLKCDKTIGVSKITFKVYSIEKDGSEKLNVEFPETVQPEWMYTWQPCLFPTGKYMVKVYNDNNQLLCSHSLEFFDWKRL